MIRIDEKRNPVEVYNMLKDIEHKRKDLNKENVLFILRGTNNPKFIRNLLKLLNNLDDDKKDEFKNVVLGIVENREQPEDIVKWVESFDDSKEFRNSFNETKKLKKGCYYLSSMMLKKVAILCGGRYNGTDWKEYCGIKVIEAPENWFIDFSDSKNLPKNIDVSCCPCVVFNSCDFENVENIDFFAGGEGNFTSSKNLHNGINFLPLSKVDLTKAELSKFKMSEDNKTNFSYNCVVKLVAALGLKGDINFDYAKDIDLFGTNLENVNGAVFSKGSAVSMLYTTIGGKWDFSNCNKVNLLGCNFDMAEELIFKNDEQIKESNILVSSENKSKIRCNNKSQKINYMRLGR